MTQAPNTLPRGRLTAAVRDAWESPASRAAAATSLLALGFAGPSVAANFTVTNLGNTGAGSLRQAVVDANDAVGADTIVFQAGLTGTITLNDQLDITDSVTITGPGAANLSVSGDNASRVFNIYNNASELDVTISGLTITSGSEINGAGIYNDNENLTLDGVRITNCAATGDGGGLWAHGSNMDLTIRNSTISGNSAGDDGGGINVKYSGGPLLIQNTVISNNTAVGDGGGIHFLYPNNDVTIENSIISGNTAAFDGGGINLYNQDAGTFTLRNSTVSGNTARMGGGISFQFYDQMAAQAVFENSTLSGNSATDGPGGGLFVGYGLVDLVNVTVVNNQSSYNGGGVFIGYQGGMDIENTIIAGNIGGDDLASGGGGVGGQGAFSVKAGKNKSSKVKIGEITPQATDGFINASNSLIQSGGAVINGTDSNNILGVAADLGTLEDNGGPTVGAPGFTTPMLTHLPNLGSPATGAGDNALVPAGGTDQRGAGYPRIVGGTVDIGAVERAAPVVVPAQPIPALGAPALAGLSALVALFGWRNRRRPG